MASERQSGSYGLRRSAAPKKFDSDFEYYYTKGKNLPDASPSHDQDTKSVKGAQVLQTSDMSVSPKRRYDVHVIETMDMKSSVSPSKRPRGRPRKYSTPVEESCVPDEADMEVSYIHLKTKRDRSAKKCEMIEQTVETVIESLDGICQNILVEEVIPQGETHVIINADLEDAEKRMHMDDLRRVRDIMEVEQAVISLPRHDEKENHSGSEIEQTVTEEVNEEILMLGMGSDEEGQMQNITEVRVEIGSSGIQAPTRKRGRYRKIKATPDTLRRLKEFGVDDKIECNECHKLLKPSSYRQHLKTHTGVKPFGCEVCDAKFTRKGDVERHIRIVHNKQKPFGCHRCPRSFGDKKNLRWHLMNHDKKLFYVCETCGFKFGKREYYENHVRFIHPIPDERFEIEEEDGEGIADLPSSLLSASMEVEGEGSNSGSLNVQTYNNANFIIRKEGNVISVVDHEEEEGETLEITESQLQNLLNQNAMGKHIAIVTPKRPQTASSSKKIIPVRKVMQKPAKNPQIIKFKDLERLTQISSEQLSKLQMTPKNSRPDNIEAVVIQIDPVSSEGEVAQAEEEEAELIVGQDESSMPLIVSSHSISEDQEHSKEVNIVVSKNSSQEVGEADANVQSLIDALLDAAKDGTGSSETT
ncbi:hypothetical protein B566_EDAN017800 [Ephemera danica]|nr:hypothetical protein B566_EDAN017800 [Ephemera danica]